MRKRIFAVGLTASVLFLAALTIASAGASKTSADGSGIISVSLAELSTDLRVYEFNDGGANVRFFAVLGTDGRPRVAFDACEVCGGRLGYEQRKSDIECRACGRVFRIDEIGTKNRASGCWPSYLPFSVGGNRILIKAEDLRKGRSLFR